MSSTLKVLTPSNKPPAVTNLNGKQKAVSAYSRSTLKPIYHQQPTTTLQSSLTARLKSSQKSDVNNVQKLEKIKDSIIRCPLNYNHDDDSEEDEEGEEEEDGGSDEERSKIPEVYRKQGTATYSLCTGYSESTCLCSSYDDPSQQTTKRLSYLDRRNWISTERLYELRKKAQESIKHHKTFTIRGCFYSIRKGLLQRGWVEKLDIHRRAPVTGLCQVVLEDFTQHLPIRRPGESRRQHLQKCERNIMSRFLEHVPIDFLWSARKEKTDWIDMARNPALTINKFHKSPFTTKEGLCTVLRDFHWFFEEGKSETYYPRSYNVWSHDDLAEFIDNFRMSACISVLRYLVETTSEHGIDAAVTAQDGPVPMSCINFAIKQCKTYIRTCLHFDIDEEPERIWDHDWDVFLTHHQMITQEHAKIQDVVLEKSPIKALIAISEKVLEEISQYWQQYNLDGIFNVWIVKPSNRCRGRGIHLMNDLKKILTFVNPPVVNKGHYVVQKYIERPLIIHNCKFDIRQWFLVTSVQPLVIWMYKESYLRFSSQEFTLINFHESVHLTNHAIQKRYKNGERDERLPRENMWDCHTFQAYLRTIGKAEMWTERIYPGMQKALIGTMLASQDTMDRRMNTFELFGADFMISEDCKPWLIEINSSPDLGASTSVTARLCPQCLEDVVKVVIDYRNDPKSSTGGFELIYKQVIPPAPAYLGLNLFLKGSQLLATKGAALKKDRSNIKSTYSKPIVHSSVKETISGNSGRPFLVDLFDCVNSENKDGPLGAGDKILKPIPKSKTVMAIKKATHLDFISSNETPVDNVKNKANNHRPSNHQSSKINKSEIKLKSTDSARRHASCGPRLMSVVVTTQPQSAANAEEQIIQEIEQNNNQSKKDLKCIGNRCCAISDSNNLPSINVVDSSIDQKVSSSRKQSLENNNKLLKPSQLSPNLLSASSRSSTSLSIASPTLTKSTKFLATNNKDYQKYVSRNVNLNKIQTRPVNDSYCSHFFAVGLSLRAWRSKYSKILKNQKDHAKLPNANTLNSNGTLNGSRKGKKPLAKIKIDLT